MKDLTVELFLYSEQTNFRKIVVRKKYLGIFGRF